MSKTHPEPQGPESTLFIKRNCSTGYCLARPWKNTSHVIPGKTSPSKTQLQGPYWALSTTDGQHQLHISSSVPNQTVISTLQTHTYKLLKAQQQCSVGVRAENYPVPSRQGYTVGSQSTQRMANSDNHTSTADPSVMEHIYNPKTQVQTVRLESCPPASTWTAPSKQITFKKQKQKKEKPQRNK